MSNQAFIRRVVDASGIKIINLTRNPKKPGRWAWARITSDEISYRPRTYSSEQLAYAAAHKDNHLRTA